MPTTLFHLLVELGAEVLDQVNVWPSTGSCSIAQLLGSHQAGSPADDLAPPATQAFTTPLALPTTETAASHEPVVAASNHASLMHTADLLDIQRVCRAFARMR